MPLLDTSELVDEKYTVKFFIKEGSYAESYRVKEPSGRIRFLKLFQLSKLHRIQLGDGGKIKEIELLKFIRHPNIVRYRNSGEYTKGGQRFAYLILDFISGETLEERLKRERIINVSETKRIVRGVLESLGYLHGQDRAILHNDLNQQNIMLDMSGDEPVPKIIDFGYVRYSQNPTKVYYREGLNPYYLAPECFDNTFSQQSDLFAIGALIYHMLSGIPPWFVEMSDYQKSRSSLEKVVLESRRKPLKIPALAGQPSLDSETERLYGVARKALDEDLDDRFQSAEEMLRAVNGEIDLKTRKHPSRGKALKAEPKNRQPRGFDDIAGMDELKDILYHDVIRALNEKDLYKEKYGLTIPNGMLLYGPPGCGKSFIALKFSEEAGHNYLEVKPSELASIYVHGSQEKIRQLFDEARKKAPTILNFEEFDALVPSRENATAHHQSGEVNEFLTQLNNCGEDGVFVIASTNQPGLIDSAVLRRGRIDKKVYVPPPDFRARKEMFRKLLEKRWTEPDMNYDLLAEKTENFVSADIKNLVDEAARKALREDSVISLGILVTTVNNTKPSVKMDEIRRYEKIREELEGVSGDHNRSRIGFL